jgi:hypothetical protein
LWTVSQMITARTTEKIFHQKSFVSQSRIGKIILGSPGFSPPGAVRFW